MVGDVNMFLSEKEVEDNGSVSEGEMQGECEIMIACEPLNTCHAELQQRTTDGKAMREKHCHSCTCDSFCLK